MIRTNKKARPLLVGEVNENGNIKVWCPYCADYHFHGWDGEREDEVQHRVAHCSNPSPFLDFHDEIGRGYYIGKAPK